MRALLKDGEIIAAAHEERFSREKHDSSFPENAVGFCLKYGGISLRELDAVVFYDKPFLKFERLLETYYAFAPKGLQSFLSAVPVWIKKKVFLKKLILDSLNGHIDIRGIIADIGFYLREFIELLEKRGLVYIIAARLYHPLQRMVYAQQNWKKIEEGIWITEFFFQHADWITDWRFIAVRQDTKKRPHAMGKELSLFGDEVDTGNYRYSVWITNSNNPAYDVKHCWHTIKELKEDFALGGFSMKYFYSTEAAMLIRVFIYNLFVLFRYQILGQKEKTERLKTLRYKYLVLPAQLGGDGRRPVLRISVFSQKVRSKLLYLFNRVGQYFPPGYCNCTAFR